MEIAYTLLILVVGGTFATFAVLEKSFADTVVVSSKSKFAKPASGGVSDDCISRQIRMASDWERAEHVASLDAQVYARAEAQKRTTFAGSSSTLKSPLAQSSADAIALATLRSCGLTEQEISEAWYIHEHESKSWTAVSSNRCVGGWQIMLSAHRDITEAQAFDPAWSTQWAVGYMRGRYGSITGAYNFKRAHGWY